MVALITGGKGDLAKRITSVFRENKHIVHAPGRDHCNINDINSISRYFGKLDKVDLLVCNAAVSQEQLLARTSLQDAQDILRTNLDGCFACAKLASKDMVKKRDGHIIFISSYMAMSPRVGQTMYATSKAALHGFAKSLAQELGPRNIRVNVILPGFLDTKMTSSLPDKIHESVREEHSLKRLNTCEAVADFIYFLHHHMPHTSGQIFNLDSRSLS